MPEIHIRRKRVLWRHGRLLLTYPVGVLVVYPAVLLALVWKFSGISPLQPLSPADAARLLPGMWLSTLFLCPLVVPFFLHLRREDVLDPQKIAVALLKVLGFTAVSLGLSVWVLRSEPGGFQLAATFHVFLLAFQVLFVGGSLFLRGLGAGGALTQVATTAAGLLMIFTVVIANFALTAAADAEKPLVIQVAVWANPAVVAARSFLEMDVFRTTPLYGFSRIADYPFLYPPWKSVALLYGAIGMGLAVLGVGLRLLLFQLPMAIRSRRQRLARENRLALQTEGAVPPPPKTDWEGLSVASEAQPDAPAEAPPATGPEPEPEEQEKMALGPLALEPEAASQGFAGEEPPKQEPPKEEKKAASFMNWLDEKAGSAAKEVPASRGGAGDLRSAFEEGDKDTSTRRQETRAFFDEPAPAPAPAPEPEPAPSAVPAAGPPEPEPPAAGAAAEPLSGGMGQAPATEGSPAPSMLADAMAEEPPASPATVDAAESPAPAGASLRDTGEPPASAEPQPAAEPSVAVPVPSDPEAGLPSPSPFQERKRTTIRFMKIPRKLPGEEPAACAGEAPEETPAGAAPSGVQPPAPAPAAEASSGAPAPEPQSGDAGGAPPAKKSVFGDLMAGWGEPPKGKTRERRKTEGKDSRFFHLDLGEDKGEEKPADGEPKP